MRILLLMLLSFNVSAWTVVYENDDQGNRVAGSESALWQAASDGLDIKVEIEFGNNIKVFECRHVYRHIDSDTVVCEAEVRVGNVTIANGSPSGLMMRDGVALFSSRGFERWYAFLGNNTELSKGLLQLNMRWFVED